MATLAEIRAKLKATEQRSNGDRTSHDNSIYPFWNLAEGGESVLRFLPDGNNDNTFFWVERAMIKLPFAGIKGEAESKKTEVQVPCVEMYGETCPILSEVRGWFKDPSLEDMGRKYWKKRSYIFQGFVVEDGLKEKESPANPIRRLIIGPQIFQTIKAALVDPELEDLPTDYVNGLDFRLKKSGKGGYADYSTSSWSRRTRPLSEAELSAINEYNLYSLVDFLPKKPGEVELKVMKEMFEASVDGEAYDPERWGQYFKPAGFGQNTGDPVANRAAQSAPKPTPKPPVVDDEEVPFETNNAPAKAEVNTEAKAEPVKSGGNDRAADILAMIRNRQKPQ